jgi:fatty acid desaturase
MSVITVKVDRDLADEVPPETLDVRESMCILPSFLQLPVTLLTGKPFVGQKPLRISPTGHLVAAGMSIVGGVTVSCLGWILSGFGLLLLAVGWAMTLHGMRNLRIMIYHQCAHQNMHGRRKLDIAIGRIISSLLIIQNFERYRREHVSDHHAVHHMTLRDPTVQAFLISLDMRPGMSRSQMWRRLLGKLSSPTFHVRFAVARVRSFARGSAPTEKVLTLVIYGMIAAIATFTKAWIPLVIVWLIPLIPLFQASNTLRLCVKHTFPSRGIVEKRGKAYFASLTNAIFLGEAVPPPQEGTVRTITCWLRWAWRMAFVHFPARYLVLTGDTVCHDYHHRHPSSRQWSNYIFARQQDCENGHRGWPPYHEAWGLVPAINRVFESLSLADPEDFDVRRISSVSKRELFSAFDD